VGLATLLVSLLLTASALALGIATLFTRDIYLSARPGVSDGTQLKTARAVIFVALALAAVFGYYIKGDLILDWSYLSNALRGVTVFFPLMGAVFLRRRLTARAGVWAVTAPPVAALAGFLITQSIHPLYIGITVSAVVMGACILYPKIFTERESC
jgi:SSS family solute:Na+ symporter